MKVLVTGGSGFLASHLVPRLAAEGDIVLTVARGEGGARGSHQHFRRDLASPDCLRGLPEVDAVVHLAQSPPGASPAQVVSTNVLGLLNTLSAPAVAKAHIILASSGNVYGRHGPFEEGQPLDPADFYGETKRLAEAAVRDFSTGRGVTVLRLFAPYGPGLRGRLMADLARRVSNGIPVLIDGDQSPIVNPIHVDDVCEVVSAILHQRIFGTYNLGGPASYDPGQIAAILGGLLGQPPTLDRRGSGPCRDLTGKTDRLRRALPGFSPMALEAGLRRWMAVESVGAW